MYVEVILVFVSMAHEWSVLSIGRRALEREFHVLSADTTAMLSILKLTHVPARGKAFVASTTAIISFALMCSLDSALESRRVNTGSAGSETRHPATFRSDASVVGGHDRNLVARVGREQGVAFGVLKKTEPKIELRLDAFG